MSCIGFDLKGYFLEELAPDERRAVAEHLNGCAACREELERLGALRGALHALRDEELPRRIAFVSDKVFEPRWFERLWQSGPRLGFASAAMLAAAIMVHAFLRPAPPAAPQVDLVAVETRLETAVRKAVAESEARQRAESTQALAAFDKRLEFERRADMLAVEENFNVMRKTMSRWYVASSEMGGGR